MLKLPCSDNPGSYEAQARFSSPWNLPIPTEIVAVSTRLTAAGSKTNNIFRIWGFAEGSFELRGGGKPRWQSLLTDNFLRDYWKFSTMAIELCGRCCAKRTMRPSREASRLGSPSSRGEYSICMTAFNRRVLKL
jgi:hypothetical protein